MGSTSAVAEQLAYYRAIAPEYEDHSIDVSGQDELRAAFESFGPRGDLLELACGPGIWTEHLARLANITAVDGAPEMLALAKTRVGDAPVRFIEANLFSWQPDRRYDHVFFGFWLSHIPDEHFDPFWSMVAQCLKPEGLIPHQADELEQRLSLLGWDITVTAGSGPFYWGSGRRR